MNAVTISFTNLKTKGVYRFDIYDHETGIVMTDHVRLNEFDNGDRVSREAVDPYGFWLDLKRFLGNRRPRLITVKPMDKSLVMHFYEKFKRLALRPRDPWLFEE